MVLRCRMPWIALKAISSGYVGTNAWSINSTTAKAFGSGVYTFYQVGSGRQLPCWAVLFYARGLRATQHGCRRASGSVIALQALMIWCLVRGHYQHCVTTD